MDQLTDVGKYSPYRFFSAQLTTDRRAMAPDVCCYMIYEFPPRY